MPYKGINWKLELPNAIELGKQGKSLKEIGEVYGVSRQRIKQVFVSHGIDPKEIGIKVLTNKSRIESAAIHKAKWGEREHSELYTSQRLKFRTKKRSAKYTGWGWEIDFGDLTWPTHCPILGMELDYFAEYRKEESPSFDRINSELGYIKGNVQVLSWRANRIKNNGTAEEHRKIAEYLDKTSKVV